MKLKIVQHVQVGFLAYFLSVYWTPPPKKKTPQKTPQNKETNNNKKTKKQKKTLVRIQYFSNSRSFIPIKCQYFFFKLPTLKACSTEQ